MQTLNAALIAFLALGASAALAQNGDPAPDKAKEKGVQIGEKVNCVDIIRIRNTRVVDDRTILFFMRGNAVYKNSLPNACPGLGFEKTFTYSTSLSRLCNTDIITVLYTTPVQRGASCGLGMFERIDPASLKQDSQKNGDEAQ
ncbi:MAG: hypothetical protein Tsb0016_21270 [Sphingomonadales bacterium]